MCCSSLEAAHRIVSWTALPNQNLHAIAEADNLILTSPIFMEQAQALADYHPNWTA